jgi:hypothetical protein
MSNSTAMLALMPLYPRLPDSVPRAEGLMFCSTNAKPSEFAPDVLKENCVEKPRWTCSRCGTPFWLYHTAPDCDLLSALITAMPPASNAAKPARARVKACRCE